jgi:tetratricopeptide (TPR) repeat protein
VTTPTDEDAAPVEPEAEPERTAVEEREFLLRSLDDLDAEYEAGDLDQADYETLRDGYVARTAEVLRAIEEHREAPADAPPPSKRTRRRSMAWMSGIAVVAVLCGWLLARSVGAKGAGDTITGEAPSALDHCQTVANQKPAEGITCYDKILRTEPENTDALTYKGWALVRLGKTAQGSALFDKVVAINAKYPDVYVFRASVKAKAGDFPGAQSELDMLYSLNPPAGVISTLQSQGLDREIAFGVLPPADHACWQSAEDGLDALSNDSSSSTGTSKITKAITCFADVLAANPNDLDALNASGYLLGASVSSATTATDALALATKAQDYLNRAVNVAPRDPTAHLLRAALENTAGNPQAAEDDLNVLKTLGRPNPLYVLSTVAAIEKNVEDQLKAATTTTSK